MTSLRTIRRLCLVLPLGLCAATTSCTTVTSKTGGSSSIIDVSVKEQKLALYKGGRLVKKYPVSTSKFGLGSSPGSYRTPLGKMRVVEKVGDGKPVGAVFKSRQWTGEVVKPNSPGRDPIVTRILRLEGLEANNRNTYSRGIYIHGTAAERDIGKPASYGCIRMKSRHILDLYKKVDAGAQVNVIEGSLKLGKKSAPASASSDKPSSRKTEKTPKTKKKRTGGRVSGRLQPVEREEKGEPGNRRPVPEAEPAPASSQPETPASAPEPESVPVAPAPEPAASAPESGSDAVGEPVPRGTPQRRAFREIPIDNT